MSSTDSGPIEAAFKEAIPAPRALRLGLRGEILIAFAVVTLFAIGVNTAVAWRIDHLMDRRRRLDSAVESAWLAASFISLPPDRAKLRMAEQRVPGLSGLAVFNQGGFEVGHAGNPGKLAGADALAVVSFGEPRAAFELADKRGPRVRAVAPLGDPALPSGAVAVWIDESAVSGTDRARSIVLAYVALNALLAGLLGWYLVSRSVVRPVQRLVDATNRVAAGELSVHLRVAGSNELSELARDFNRMTEALSRKVSELEAANTSLRAAREEVIQSEKLASVGRLAAGVAHELGNPVSAIVGYVSLLLRGRASDTAEDAEILRRVERETARIDRIIRDLLEYSRPRPAALEVLDVHQVIESALTIVAAQKGFREIELARNLGAPVHVLGDAHRLSQVLVNLLINAADALEGVNVKRIEISTFETTFPAPAERRRRQGEAATTTRRAAAIRVEDTGKGIDPATKGRLFEPFFTTRETGTGLGLAISRTIIESMGGDITAEGTASGGAAFTVLLPAAEEPMTGRT